MKFPRLLTLALLSVAVAAGGQTLSLDEARNLALRNNAQYQAKQAELEAARWSRMTALSGFLPTLSLDGTWLYMDPAATYQAGAASVSLNKDIRSFGLSLSQPLFLGGKIWQAYQMARIAEGMAETALTAQKHTLLTEVDKLYLATLQTQNLQSLSNLDLLSAQRNLELARLKLDNGLISNADYLRFQSRLASKEVAQLQTQSALQLAQLQLRNYLGLDDPPTVADLPGLEQDPELAVLDAYDTQATRALTQAALDLGKSGNSALRLLEDSLELSRRAYKIRKGSFLPSLMLIGSRNYEENGIDRYEFTASNQILLNASLPLLPQLGNYAELQKARFDHRKALLEAQTASDGILLGFDAAVLNLVSTAKQVRAARIALDYTQQTYDQLQERFRLNMLSATELLDAELMLSAAKLAHNNSVYAYHQARVSLLEVLGLDDYQILNNLIITGANE